MRIFLAFPAFCIFVTCPTTEMARKWAILGTKTILLVRTFKYHVTSLSTMVTLFGFTSAKECLYLACLCILITIFSTFQSKAFMHCLDQFSRYHRFRFHFAKPLDLFYLVSISSGIHNRQHIFLLINLNFKTWLDDCNLFSKFSRIFSFRVRQPHQFLRQLRLRQYIARSEIVLQVLLNFARKSWRTIVRSHIFDEIKMLFSLERQRQEMHCYQVYCFKF